MIHVSLHMQTMTEVIPLHKAYESMADAPKPGHSLERDPMGARVVRALERWKSRKRMQRSRKRRADIEVNHAMTY